MNKLKTVEEECDESLYWLDLIVESRVMPLNRLAGLMKEGDEILSIVVAALKRTHAAGSS